MPHETTPIFSVKNGDRTYRRDTLYGIKTINISSDEIDGCHVVRVHDKGLLAKTRRLNIPRSLERPNEGWAVELRYYEAYSGASQTVQVTRQQQNNQSDAENYLP